MTNGLLAQLRLSGESFSAEGNYKYTEGERPSTTLGASHAAGENEDDTSNAALVLVFPDCREYCSNYLRKVC